MNKPMNRPDSKPKKQMNKWLVGAIIAFAVIGCLVLYVGSKAKKAIHDLDNLMGSVSDKELAQVCMEMESDPKAKANLERMKEKSPEVNAMLEKLSPGAAKYNRRLIKMCASDYKAVLDNKAKK